MHTKKTVIITGASSGIGFALTEAYLKRDYNVVGNARTQNRLEQAATRLGRPKNLLLVAGDAEPLLSGPALEPAAGLALREIHRSGEHLFLHYAVSR